MYHAAKAATNESATWNPIEHTPNHRNCPACEARLRRTMLPSISPDQEFSQAAEIWIESRNFNGNPRARYVAKGTIQSYEQYITALNRFFSSLPLSEIHIGHLKEYQEQRSRGLLGTRESEVLARAAKQYKVTIEKLTSDPRFAAIVVKKLAAAKREVSANKVNQELGTLIRILCRANLWTDEREEEYERLLCEEADIPRSMSPTEQEFFLELAASRSEWQFVYWYALVALRTTLTNCEMRHLRLGDINLHSGVIYVQPAYVKNKYRVRSVPLAPDSLWAIRRIVDRAHELGSSEPQHYAMPFRCKRGEYSPLEPMSNSGIKKPWNSLRKAAGLPHMRVHDLRHTAITRLAEAGTPIPVIMSMAGHISRRMMQHYTQISEQAQRQAVMAVYGKSQYDSLRKSPQSELQTFENRVPKLTQKYS